MPKRKIPKSYQNVTGLLSSSTNNAMVGYESPLERDFYEILDFDLNVRSFEEQPVTIEYRDENDKLHTYTPDTLVIFRDDIVPAKDMKPWLCEVKPRKHLLAKLPEYRPKFKAAIRYAKEKGWLFRIFTEREIRTPYLQNVKFLREYRKIPTNEKHKELLLKTLYELRETDPETLLMNIFQDKWNRAEMMPTLWRLIADVWIAADLSLPLTMKSRIWYR